MFGFTNIEHGAQRCGTPIVLIHGNFSMVQDWELSDVTRRLALNHRVVVFDRPGFGYTDRPAGSKSVPFQRGGYA